MANLSAKKLIIDLAIIVAVPFVFTAALGLYGAMRPQRALSDVVPEQYGLEYSNVTLTTSDGLKLAAWYVPRNGEPTDTAVIVLHGYPADKGDLLPRSSFLIDRYNLLYVDFRYFGRSEGSYTTAGAREVRDLLAAVDHLKKERGMRQIGVYGFSMGGAVALMGAAQTDDIDAVVAEAPYADLASMVDEMYRYLGPMQGPLAWSTDTFAKVVLRTDLSDVSPEKAVRGLKTPVLLVHSREDKVIPFRNAERILAAMEGNPNAERLIFDTGEHGEPSVEFAQRVASFFAEHLGLPDDMTGPDDHEDSSVPQDGGA